ncbi:BNR repeat protein [Prosthecobacter fusiformis]|uniref:BNR repeat protein n=1 Tax=Prosthecobacter fusiformis TaxID=48464 RepID=A0A4R7SNH7_9BACT|nr:sialidase family protein [Prosthecobacter fusiformis]TDU80720.1 BNR repeat protein [Prosthecobacter fusiformis]
MKFYALFLFGMASVGLAQAADDEGIQWLVNYDGKAVPDGAWTAVGKPQASLEKDGLRLADDATGFGHYRQGWKAGPEDEIIVEATVKTGAITGASKNKPATSLWPWRDGAPVMVQVSDGRHQDGLVLFPAQATSFTDRFIPMDTTNRFHTYRLVIRGTDMSMWVDGVQKVTGQNAFWKKADSPEPFIQFGSSAKVPAGEAWWASVKLGVRKVTAPLPKDPVKITVSEPWAIPREDVRQTRPYLYDMGQGLLLMSVAQGPDALYEPYGLLKSTDAGKTWTPIPGLDKLDTTPLPVLRRPDGSILAASRWTWLQPDGSLLAKTVHLDVTASKFTMMDSKIVLPKLYANEDKNDQTICERHIWNDDDGGATMVIWTRKRVPRADGRRDTERWSHLVKTTDNGLTWNYVSTIGPGGEPAAVRLSPTEMTAVIRGDRDSQMKQMFSRDAGKTWSKPIAMEEGKVLPDLVLMSNGVLACSYGRPASCIMFSLDGGKTWPSHHVVSDRVSFNYTSIREISPGRLLYVHDAPRMNALYIDVETVN